MGAGRTGFKSSSATRWPRGLLRGLQCPFRSGDNDRPPRGAARGTRMVGGIAHQAWRPTRAPLIFTFSNPGRSGARAPQGATCSTCTNPQGPTLQLQGGREVSGLLHDALPGTLRCLFPLCHHLELHSEGSNDRIVVVDHSVCSHHLGAVRGQNGDDRSDSRELSALGISVG